MHIEYNKLIRDKIPEIIHKAGKTYEVVVMGDDGNPSHGRTINQLVEEYAKSKPHLIRATATHGGGGSLPSVPGSNGTSADSKYDFSAGGDGYRKLFRDLHEQGKI